MPYSGAMENELIIPFDAFTDAVIAITDRNMREQAYVAKGPRGYSQADLDEFQYGQL